MQGDPAFTLNIYQERRQGNQQLYDVFQFGCVEGIMRFEKPMQCHNPDLLEVTWRSAKGKMWVMDSRHHIKNITYISEFV